MKVMQLSDLDLSKTHSYADYLQWTFDERLVLINGKIFKMTPAPNLAFPGGTPPLLLVTLLPPLFCQALNCL